MWHLGTWLSDELGSAGLDLISEVFSNLNNSVRDATGEPLSMFKFSSPLSAVTRVYFWLISAQE